jgi:hypothetical protein
MIDVQRVGTYFFILGVLISIFSGGFAVSADMQVVVLLLIIITGGFVGLLNIEEEREFHFLLAGGVFIIAVQALHAYLTGLQLLEDFTQMLNNLVIFTSTACIVVGLKLIFHYASVKRVDKQVEDTEFDDPKRQAAWDFVIFITVCLAFVIFILEAFFFTNGLTVPLEYASYVIIFIFLVDAVILFGRSKNIWTFFTNHWIDVVSVIPLAYAFQLAKLFRFTRIAQAFSRSSRIGRLSKISHSAKFFSKHSGFNKYLEQEEEK